MKLIWGLILFGGITAIFFFSWNGHRKFSQSFTRSFGARLCHTVAWQTAEWTVTVNLCLIAGQTRNLVMHVGILTQLFTKPIS